MEKLSRYVLEIGGDGTDLNAVFAGIKSKVRSDVAELKQITDRVELFAGIQDSLPQVQRALDSAKQKVRDFTAEIERIKGSNGKPTKELTDGLAAAEKAAAQATKEFQRQQQQLATLDSALTKAGVNTKQLAAEQIRLAEASKVAADAAAQTAAKQALGLTTLKDIAPEVARLRAQFDLLKNSGTLSATEIAGAQRQLDGRIKELTASVNTNAQSFKSLQMEARDTFGPLLLKVTAVVGAITAVAAALHGVTEAAKSYNNELAKVGTVTTLGKESLGELGEGARKLAGELGIGVTDALKALYELIRSGVPADNALEVLRVSAIAAKAAFTDTATGAKAASVLIDAFGIDVKDLSGALDKVVKSAQNGGPTLAEFAENAGGLGNVARATGIEFNELIAVLNVMTDASNDAAGSASTLTKILVAMNKPETRQGLRDYNIEGLSFIDTLRAIAAKVPGGINAFFELGIASTKAAVGVAAIVNESERLPKALNDAATAAGTAAATFAKIYNTPAERAKRFDAQLEETKIQLGGVVGASSGALAALTGLLKVMNAGIDQATKFSASLGATGKAIDGFTGGFSGALVRILTTLGTVKPAAESAGAAVVKFGVDVGDQASRTQARLAKLAADEADALLKLGKLSTDLLALADKIRAVGGEGLNEINLRAQAEIDALLRTTEARKAALLERETNLTRFAEIRDQDTRAATVAQIKAQETERIAVANATAQILAIQVKAAADRLQLIQDTEKSVAKAIDEAFIARRAEAGENTKKLKELDDEEGKVRVANIGKTLAAYRDFYKDLVAQSRSYVDKVKAIETERVSFNQSVQDAITDIRNRSLTGIDAYGAKIIQIEKSIERATQARLNGNRELEKQYTTEAIAGAKSLGEVTDKNGKVVVTQQKAQEDAIRLAEKASDGYNESLDEQDDAAKRGAKATQDGLNAVKPIIDDLQKKFDKLAASTAEEIKLRIHKDIVGLVQAEQDLERLVRDRIARITVQYVTPDGGPAPAPGGEGSPDFVGPPQFNRGGPVHAVRKFANGGPVFNRPSWSKVPGVGNFDSVPALLREGSFVVRKAASQKYGDGAMAMLARGYAKGGVVSGSEDWRAVIAYAQSLFPFLRHPMFTDVQKLMFDDVQSLSRTGGRDKSSLKHLFGLSQDVASNYYLKDFWGKTSQGVSKQNVEKALPSFEEFLLKYNAASTRRFASGGRVDSVHAMLTPGEVVINPPAVASIARRFGSGFLPALNAMRIPAPTIPRFAQGGPVGDVPGWKPGSSGGAGIGGMTFGNIIINTPYPVDDDRTIRHLMQRINVVQARTGKRIVTK